MSISYKPLFTLRIKHDYYADGWARGLTLVPCPSTQQLMKAQRMLFRNMPYGSVVLYRTEAKGSKPFIALPEKLTFTFALYAETPKQFFNITQMEVVDAGPSLPTFKEPDTIKPPPLLFYRNNEKKVPLLADRLGGLEPPLFSILFEAESSVSSVPFRVKNAEGAFVGFLWETEDGPLLDEGTAKPAGPGQTYFEQQVDLRHLPEGRYELQADNQLLATRYVSNGIAPERLAALVEIAIDEPGEKNNGLEFDLEFHRRGAFWKYLIANKSGKANFEQHPPLLIADPDLTVPDVYGSPAFTTVDVPKPIVQGYPTLVFMSDTEMPFYEQPFPGLLELTYGSGALKNHLPSASSSSTLKWNKTDERYESEIYVFV